MRLLKHNHLKQLLQSKEARKIGLISIIFVFYLATLPNIIAFLVPCLRPLSGTSYSFGECNITLAMNWFLILSLAMFALLVLLFFVLRSSKQLKPTIFISLFLAISTILAFLYFIPQAESQIAKAPLLLESLKNEMEK